MSLRKFALLLLALSTFLTVSAAAQDGKVYWSERNVGLIRRANLDGTMVETVLSGLVAPDGIAVDGVGEWIYFAEQGPSQGDGKIRRAKLNGTMLQDLVTDQTFPLAITIDVGTNKIYFSDAVDDLIRVCDLDGSNLHTILSNIFFPFGLDLDVASGKIYWTTDGENKLRRANLDGSNVEDLVSAGVLSPFGLALDLANGHMYWCDQAPLSHINRGNLDGTGVITVVSSGIAAPVGIDLDVPRGKMYWASITDGIVYRANLDGTQVQEIVTGLTTSKQVALDLVPFGACCRGVLGCVKVKEHQCTALGGQYLGDETICFATNTCGDAETDQCAIASGQLDCQADGVPDVCQTSLPDCQPDGIPDQCQVDGNDDIPTGGDGAPDECNTACVNTVDCSNGFECLNFVCIDTCASAVDCDDARVCTFDSCAVNICDWLAINFGDANGSGGTTNLDDILCVLRGFAAISMCPNADIAPPCAGNNLINLDDILAVLGAFAGNDPCACGP